MSTWSLIVLRLTAAGERASPEMFSDYIFLTYPITMTNSGVFAMTQVGSRICKY